MKTDKIERANKDFANLDELLEWAKSLNTEDVLALSGMKYKRAWLLYEYASHRLKERGTPLTPGIDTCKIPITQQGKNSSLVRKDNDMSYKVLPSNTFSGELFRFETPGDSIEGVLKALRNVNTENGAGIVADMETEEGNKSFFLSTTLKSRLTPDMVDLQLKITYTGDVTGKKGGRPYKNYEIAVWTEDEEDISF